MLILILIDVQYPQKAVFNLEKASNRQNHSPSRSFHLVKKSFPSKISDSTLTGQMSPHPLLLFGKPSFHPIF